MKHILSLITALLLALPVMAQETVKVEAPYKGGSRTNLYDKVPHDYVGQVALEIASPGAYGGSMGGVSTTHGYMVRPTVFVGAGVAYYHSFDVKQFVVPIFAEGRIYFPSEHMRRIYPHISLRLGGQVASEGKPSFYSQAAVGIRVPFSDQLALAVEVGPQYAGKYERNATDKTLTANQPFVAKGHAISFFGRVAFEF